MPKFPEEIYVQHNYPDSEQEYLLAEADKLLAGKIDIEDAPEGYVRRVGVYKLERIVRLEHKEEVIEHLG